MGTIDKSHSIFSAAHGFDDAGFAQTAGSITSIAQYKVGKYAKYAMVTASAAHLLTKGQPINIAGTTYYDGPTRVLAIVNSTQFVIKRAFAVTATGSWDIKSGLGNWDAFMPIGANLTAANIAFEFHNADLQGANESSVDYTKDIMYPMPGGIKKFTISTAGNIRLIRAATTTPYFRNRNMSTPTVVGFNPTGAAVGATVDILGTNFSPIPDNNAVTFISGKKAVVTAATEEILTVTIPTGAVTGIVTVVTARGQNATGPTFNVN